MDNLINPFQLKEFDSKLYNMLGKNGFAIVPAEHQSTIPRNMRRTTMLISQASLPPISIYNFSTSILIVFYVM